MSDAQPSSAVRTRLIVIGASAGGLAPLRTIVGALPADLPATVLVVMHIPSTASSVLPEILSRASDLSVSAAHDGAELRPGRVIVAPPDRHLVVGGECAGLTRGPRENGHRPSVDALFRSAAEEYGAACCGVILSGTRDDGSVGLAQIKAHGGAAVVQEPVDAQYDGMPANALAATDVDYVLPAAEIAEVLVALATEGRQVLTGDDPAADPPGRPEILSILCPECGGTLFEGDDAGVTHFRCHVGHRYSARSLLAAHADGVERAMWTAVRSLEDRAALLRRVADRLTGHGGVSGSRLAEQARAADEQARTIRVAIAALDDTAIEPRPVPDEAAS